MIKNNSIMIRCEFIDLLEHLENISIDYADLKVFEDFIYYDIKNNDTYKISKVVNNNETYLFQFITTDNTYINIPNAIFMPDVQYDFEIDLINKKIRKMDEFKKIELHTIINIDNNINRIKKKSLLRKILGC
jgi:hypothetical protein